MATLESVLSDINEDANGGIFLPYIQRDFVWEPKRIYALLDSLMRGYPVGTILMWQTNASINYRKFAKDYDPKNPGYAFNEGDDRFARCYVLDGQQRLQSLYIARYGSYDGKVLFFDLASDRNSEDGYVFEFKEKDFKEPGWLNVPDFLQRTFLGVGTIPQILEEEGTIPSKHSRKALMGTNAINFFNMFKVVPDPIPIQKLDQNAGITLDDIVKIFVRVNSEGVVLGMEDLIMSLLKGRWVTAGEEFSQLADIIYDNGLREPKKFIIRSCLAALIQNPAMTEANLREFNTERFQNILSQRFPSISEAISDVLLFIASIDFIRNFNIPYDNPLLILVTYRYAQGKEAWDEIKDNKALAFLFIAFLSKALSKPTKTVMTKLLEYASRKGNTFSLTSIKRICPNLDITQETIQSIRIKNDPLADLVMALFYYGKHGYDPMKMTEKDHIFPTALLKKYKKAGVPSYKVHEYDSIANCEMLTPEENRDKSATPAVEFLSEKDEAFLALHEIPYSQKKGSLPMGPEPFWHIDNYRSFLVERGKRLTDQINKSINAIANGIVPDDIVLPASIPQTEGATPPPPPPPPTFMERLMGLFKK